MKKISLDEFLRLRKLVHRCARPLDYARWKLLFEDGSRDDFLSVLSSYQNEDGGFGYNLECNNWNPNSAPYTVCIALDHLDAAGEGESAVRDRIVAGILKYLGSGACLLDGGWVGMQGIPSNNDFAHMPWFHFDASKEPYADIGVTKRLADFILRHADRDSELYRLAEGLKARYQGCGQVLLHGYPDYDPAALNIQAYDPATYPAWLPLPVYYIGSPDSSDYPACQRTVEMNLDTIADRLLGTREFTLPSAEEMDAYEKSNPHPDGKRWCVPEQTIGNYYWGSHSIVTDLDILQKFGRLNFELPVRIP
ncbi:MAG: hypothetical protein J1E43_06335 [Christensenellaceae bacterium]|nr:hypothetical protein [Christensenellaceae bacterium]